MTDHKLTAIEHSGFDLGVLRGTAVDLLRTIENYQDRWDQVSDEERDFIVGALERAVADMGTSIDRITGVREPNEESVFGAKWFKDSDVERASRSWPPTADVMYNLRRVMGVADEIRDRLGCPLILRSAWRPSDNDSMHRFGAAMDLDIVDPDPSKIDRLRMITVCMWREKKINGLGFYHRPSHRVHVDVSCRGGKGHRFWHEDEVEPFLIRYRRGERA